MTATRIIDTNHDVTRHLSALKAAGVQTIIRYISAINPSGEKTIKPLEAHAIAAAGLRLGLVCEGWGDFAHGGISSVAGSRDAKFCLSYAATLGAPDDACIYFAVDTDASDQQIQGLVTPYFNAIGDVFTDDTPYRIGAYGSGDVCSAVDDLVDLTWLSCSLGWSGSREYLTEQPIPWALRQHNPQIIAGLDTDPNDSSGDIGDFVPFAMGGQA